MDPATLAADVALVASVLKVATAVYTTVEQITPFVEALYQVAIGKQALTDEQRATLTATETDLRAQIDAAIAAAT